MPVVPVNANQAGTMTWPALGSNEWMSENDSFIADPADGAFEDWFEIHNAALPAKLIVPAGFNIPANGFLRVRADNSTVQTAPGQLHASFRLSNAGESLLLSAPDCTLVDSITFGAQTANTAAGRTYCIQQSTDRSAWSRFGPDLTAARATTTVNDPAGLALPRKFYRVEIVP